MFAVLHAWMLCFQDGVQITEREELKVLSSAKELLRGDEDLPWYSLDRGKEVRLGLFDEWFGGPPVL